MVLSDEHYMQEAIQLAKLAKSKGEVPVGAVIVYEGRIIARGYNQPISKHDPTAHAEIMALREAGIELKNYRLTNTTLYCTLEPCVMCAGAIVHARVSRVVFGARDERVGACGSVFNMTQGTPFNHRVETTPDVLSEDCATLLTQFFKQKRNK